MSLRAFGMEFGVLQVRGNSNHHQKIGVGGFADGDGIPWLTPVVPRDAAPGEMTATASAGTLIKLCWHDVIWIGRYM